MQLKNDFHLEDRSYYAFEKCCIECNSNQMIELHHVMGRGQKNSDSILNSALICRDCHANYTSLDKGKLLKKTLRFLLANNYKFKQKDIDFYLRHKKYYEKKV